MTPVDRSQRVAAPQLHQSDLRPSRTCGSSRTSDRRGSTGCSGVTLGTLCRPWRLPDRRTGGDRSGPGADRTGASSRGAGVTLFRFRQHHSRRCHPSPSHQSHRRHRCHPAAPPAPPRRWCRQPRGTSGATAPVAPLSPLAPVAPSHRWCRQRQRHQPRCTLGASRHRSLAGVGPRAPGGTILGHRGPAGRRRHHCAGVTLALDAPWSTGSAGGTRSHLRRPRHRAPVTPSGT